jgi:hypothetical protein
VISLICRRHWGMKGEVFVQTGFRELQACKIKRCVCLVFADIRVMVNAITLCYCILFDISHGAPPCPKAPVPPCPEPPMPGPPALGLMVPAPVPRAPEPPTPLPRTDISKPKEPGPPAPAPATLASPGGNAYQSASYYSFTIKQE